MIKLTFTKEKKKYYIDAMKKHRKADKLIRGFWFRNGHGCFFGCLMQTEEFPLEKAIKEMDLPSWLIYLAEAIYEHLPNGEWLDWPVNLLQAIPCEADISCIRHQLSIARLNKLLGKNKSVAPAITKVIEYHELSLSCVDSNKIESVGKSAASAAASASASATTAVSASWTAASASLASALLAASSAVRSVAAEEAESAASAAASASSSSEAEESWSEEKTMLLSLLKNFND